MYERKADEFDQFYRRHLLYALKKGTCNKESFFFKVWEIVEGRINNLKAKDPFSSYHDRYIFRIEKLQQFQKYLNSIDKWNARPSHIVIAEKEEIIQRQKEKIEELQGQLDSLKVYEVTQKIWIEEGYAPTLIDLFKLGASPF